MGKIAEKRLIAGGQFHGLGPEWLDQAFREGNSAGHCDNSSFFHFAEERLQERNIYRMLLESINENHGVQGDLLALQRFEKGNHSQLSRSFLIYALGSIPFQVSLPNPIMNSVKDVGLGRMKITPLISSTKTSSRG